MRRMTGAAVLVILAATSASPLTADWQPVEERAARASQQELVTGNPGAQDDREFYPGAEYDGAIPTLEDVVGHAWAERISSAEEITQYLRALDAASPLTRLVGYGTSWEGRPLQYLVVASAENMARLEEIQAGMQQLADPRSISASDAERLIASLPSITPHRPSRRAT